jgi:hypothetical protein
VLMPPRSVSCWNCSRSRYTRKRTPLRASPASSAASSRFGEAVHRQIDERFAVSSWASSLRSRRVEVRLGLRAGRDGHQKDTEENESRSTHRPSLSVFAISSR